MRDYLSGKQSDAADIFPRFAALLAQLHRHGVLFRSVHFGNVIVMPDGRLGLIDVADMRKPLWGALTLKQRLRNFRHMLRYAEDCRLLAAYGVSRFATDYALASEMDARHFASLNETLAALTANHRP